MCVLTERGWGNRSLCLDRVQLTHHYTELEDGRSGSIAYTELEDGWGSPTIITPRKDTVTSFSVLGQIFWAGRKWRQIRKCSCLIDKRRRDVRGNRKELVTQSNHDRV